jgi:formylmethanofuran dehydrogenase subunit E
MKKELLKHLNSMYKYVEYWNKMGPFPRYDTEWQIDIKNYINKIKMNKDNDYDKEPVFACKHCGTLVVPNQYEVDDDGNEICQRCNSINDVKEYKNIFEYNKEQKIKPKY